jgi:hypothetical protein
MNKIFLILFGLMLSVSAFAEGAAEKVAEVPMLEQPMEVGDLSQFFPALLDAYKNSNWLILGAIIALILTLLVRKYVLPMMKLGSGVLPFVSALLGLISGVGLAVANGASLQAASMAVLSGPLASTLWNSGAKYFFKK